MKSDRIRTVIILTVPWLIIAGMIVIAYLPILTGEKYLLSVKPADPRNFFRGNYVNLRYDFTNISRKDLKVTLNAKKTYQYGDRLKLTLRKSGDILVPSGIEDGDTIADAIRLNVQPRWNMNPMDEEFALVSGLESFFAPQGAALAWEEALRDGMVLAEVSIDKTGRARLVRLIRKPQKR
jgi:uncharacterized membrane-anchored protein